MDFGSSFVYMYESPDFEVISDEEYEGGMQVSESDSSDDELEAVENAYEGLALDPVNSETGDRELDEADSTVEVPAPPPPPPPQPRRSINADPLHARKKKAHWKQGISSHGQKGQKVRSGDTNVLSIKFDHLISPSNMHAGDPHYCSGCGAILSKISKLENQGDEKVWTCEFCSTRTVVDVEDEEIPQEEDMTFMLEPALSTKVSGPSGIDESLVVFCVDVSGSMCVTTEVPGHVQLRGAESLRRARMLNRERGDQYLPRQRRDVTYVSRLQSVQAAIDHQLQEMEKEFPNRRVALITFSNEVTIIGDGKIDPVSLSGDKLSSKDALKTAAGEVTLPESIKTTRGALGTKLFELEECGPTALGPALIVASTLAARVRGSKVILCTDGLANIGMGKLDNFKTEEEKEASLKFYDEIGNCAADDGVSISVITIKGTDCKLVEIGKLADNTGGQVNIVDPLKLTQEFSTILANQIIATNVVSTCILHKQLFFFYEETEESKVVKKVGNVTVDTEITFEYGVRTNKKEGQTDETETSKTETDSQIGNQPPEADSEKDKTEQTSSNPDQANEKTSEIPAQNTNPADQPGPSDQAEVGGTSDLGGGACSKEQEEEPELKELPFQLQIVYTDTEGTKALRVLTKVKPVTRDRQKAEKMAKLGVLASHTVQTSAKMALEGKYTMSRTTALRNQRVAWRFSKDPEHSKEARQEYKKKFAKIRSIENYVNARQKSERATSGHTYSDEEGEVYECPEMVGDCDEVYEDPDRTPAKKRASFLSKLRKTRSETTEDYGANLVLRGKGSKRFFESDD